MTPELRLDYHIADNAITPFLGVYVIAKEVYEEGELPTGPDVAQVTLVPGARIRQAELADAAQFACDAANSQRPTSASRALKVAADALIESRRVRSGDIARLAHALNNASIRLKQNAVMPCHSTDAIEDAIRTAAQCRSDHGYTQTAVIVQTQYEPGRYSLGFRFEDAKPGAVLQNSDHTLSEVLATVSDTGIERLPYADGEVLGLDGDDRVICWNKATQQAENTGETVEEYGIHNLLAGEIERVEVTHQQWVGACLISTLPPLYDHGHQSGFTFRRETDGAYTAQEWRAGELQSDGRGRFIDVLKWVRQSGGEHNTWRAMHGMPPLAIPDMPQRLPTLSAELVQRVLAEHDEAADPARIGHYVSLEGLAEKVRSNRNWAQGEIFCCALPSTGFVVMKQVAPSSCEMLTITQNGFHDVLTAYRYEQDELVSLLESYVAPKPTTTDPAIDEPVSAPAFGA